MAKTVDILHPAQTLSRQLFSLPETSFLVHQFTGFRQLHFCLLFLQKYSPSFIITKGSIDQEAPWRRVSTVSSHFIRASFEAKPLFTCSQPLLAKWVCLGSTEPVAHSGLTGPSCWGGPQGIGCALDNCSYSVGNVSQRLTDSTCLLNVPNKGKCQIHLCVWRYFQNRPCGALLLVLGHKEKWLKLWTWSLPAHLQEWCVWLGQLHT